MSEDMMYQAVINNKGQHDGVFFYAVKTTGVVCRPSCKSKAPKRDNVTFFYALEDALLQGYRPCKRCRPDLGPRYMPEMDAVHAACGMMYREYAHPGLLRELPSRIGISSSHFQRMFKKTTGETPGVYLKKLRIAKAAGLLNDSSLGNIHICMAAGFTNLSSFYAAFRSETGLSPKEYRQAKKTKGDSNDYFL